MSPAAAVRFAGCWRLGDRPDAGVLRLPDACRTAALPLPGCDALYAAADTAAAAAATANFFACSTEISRQEPAEDLGCS